MRIMFCKPFNQINILIYNYSSLDYLFCMFYGQEQHQKSTRPYRFKKQNFVAKLSVSISFSSQETN